MFIVVDEIRSALTAVEPDAVFIYGRSFDSALQSSILDTDIAYVYLDPLVKTANINSNSESYSVSIGFIKQDSPDSSEEEREDLVNEMDDLCLDFLTQLFSLSVANDGTILMFDSYTVTPIYRIKNVCSGVLCTFSLTGVRPC